ncbi:PAS domain-containing protein [Ferrovibrio sp.]|uniref:PAS domain-containing protein n=1 Tax=Ferrovibrio sp. TaxID=1917215 RepID=UPI002632F08B|nr:PAS domain-containing protein [Ferrovibrio sp.]
MGDFLAKLPGPLSAPSRRFFSLWQDWRHGRALPTWRDIDLAALGDQARMCMLVEIRSRDDVHIVMAGPGIAERIGFDLTGCNYLDLTTPENRATRAQLTLEQILQPCGFMLYYWLRYPGDVVLPVEWVGAPVCSDGAAIPDLILSCATPLARIAVAGVADPDSYVMGDGMRFIDIGFGIPAANPNQPLNLQQAH